MHYRVTVRSRSSLAGNGDAAGGCCSACKSSGGNCSPEISSLFSAMPDLGGQLGASRSEYESYLNLPQVKAALDTIAWAEGGQYNNIFGGGYFSGSQHPNRCIPYQNTCSTAAGRYQFLYSTWIEIKNRLGLADFSPRNQDIAAVDLIRQRGQLSNLLAGNFEAVMRGLGCAWAALPYATCGQVRRPLAQTMNYYNAALAVYGGSVVTGGASAGFSTAGMTPEEIEYCSTYPEDCGYSSGSNDSGIPLALVALIGLLLLA